MSPELTYVVESLGTVVLFGGALWIALWGVRRMGVSTSGGALEVLARKPLDGRRAIYLVRVGKRVLIVGATDTALTRLGSTSVEALATENVDTEKAELKAEHAPARARGFRDALSRVLRGPKG